MGIWSRKSIAVLQGEAAGEEGTHTLKRALGALNLTTLGIGAIIGAGIFVLTGTAAAQYAGPAIVYSFILAGLGCLFAGLCYAEFAAMIPSQAAHTRTATPLSVSSLRGSSDGISSSSICSERRRLP